MNSQRNRANTSATKGRAMLPSEEKPWLKYYDQEFDETDIPEMSIYQLAYLENASRMDSVALDIRSSVNGFEPLAQITYSDFFSNVQECAKSLCAIGTKEDEIIPILLPNIPEARYIIYANSALGAVSFPVSPLMPSVQLKDFLNSHDIHTIFVFLGFFEKYKNVLKNCATLKHIIFLCGLESTTIPCQYPAFDLPICLPWSNFIDFSRKISEEIHPFYKPNHITAIIGTSGTTGKPKFVCLTDRNINTAALAYRNGKLFDGKKFMDALLPSIGYGISMLHYQTVAGWYVFLIAELLTDNFTDVLCKLKPDNFPGGPIHYLNLLDSIRNKGVHLPTFRNLVSGGASLPQEVEEQLNGVQSEYIEDGYNPNLIVRQGYGLSENVAIGSYSKHGAYAFGSIGVPVPYVTIGIFQPGTDVELPYYAQGELCITGPSVMKSYLDDPEETAEVLIEHSDGRKWIHTKDIAYMDHMGHIFHIDRIKNIFMRKGFNVHPSKIAEYLNTLPLVRNSVVIGFPHPEEQYVPIAFVELNKQTVSDANLSRIKEALHEQCFQNLEETSIPYGYVFVNRLPVNIGGKIDIQRIRHSAGIDLFSNCRLPEYMDF